MPEVFSVETSLLLNDRMLAGLRSVSRELRTIQGQLGRTQGDQHGARLLAAIRRVGGSAEMQRMRQPSQASH